MTRVSLPGNRENNFGKQSQPAHVKPVPQTRIERNSQHGRDELAVKKRKMIFEAIQIDIFEKLCRVASLIIVHQE